jgi:Na+/melibiose symporter-like transporter
MTGDADGGLSRRVLLAYALPALVVSLPTIPVYIHLPSLYGVQLGLGLATTGFILLLARLFDTVSDPLIGVLSDRYGVRGARRKPWIAAGAVIAGVGLVKLLNPGAGADAAYLLIWSVVLYAGWTMVAVPYLAWGAELSAGYDARTRITAWREGLGLIGILSAGVLTSATADMGWSEARSTGAVAWMAAGLGVVVFPLLLWGVPDRAPEGPNQRRFAWGALRDGVRTLAGNKPFCRLLAAWFLNGLANGIPAALFFIYLEHGLGAGPADRPQFVVTYFLAAVLAIPLWTRLSRRFGKHRVWCGAMILASIAFALVPFLPAGAFAGFAVVCVITGMALGADLALPPAMQADVVDYDRWRFRRDRAGLQFALWGMATKLALALAVGTALPAVEAFGFNPNQPEKAGIWALSVIYAWLPVVIKVSAIAAMWRFPLTAARQATIRRRLNPGRPGPKTTTEAVS